MSHWKRNLIVLCFAQLLTLIGFSAYLPFIPYYVQELGAQSYAEATAWLAVFDSGAAMAMMLLSPVWGTLADRYGRKPMLVRATLAGAVLAFLMSLATSPTQLVALRILQGALCGTVAAANTLVATETPDESLGKGLGIMQTTQFVGQAAGPLVGGLAADAFGYRAVFPISSGMMAVALIAIIAFVRERARTVPAKQPKARRHPTRQLLSTIATRNTLVLLVALASNSFALSVLSPIVSLYIKSLSASTEGLATLAGAITSVSALSASTSALALGHLGDKIGRKTVLLGCVIGVALIHVPQALATSPLQLLVLRAIQGLFMGGVIPTANALLAQSTPVSQRGAIFGLVTSVQAGGRAVGPLVGAGVSNSWGMRSAFWLTAGIFALISALVGGLVRERQLPEAEHEPALGAAQPAEGHGLACPAASPEWACPCQPKASTPAKPGRP